MATPGQLANQMQAITNQMSGLTPMASSDIYRELAGRVGNFQPQYQELADAQTNAYTTAPKMMTGYLQKFGSGAGGGANAMSFLSNILQRTGDAQGRVGTLSNVIGAQKGRLEDLANSVNENLMQRRQALNEQYNMLVPRYQNANNIIFRNEDRQTEQQKILLQQQEAALQRAMAERQFAEQQRQFNEQQKLAWYGATKSGGNGGDGGSVRLGNYTQNPSNTQQVQQQTQTGPQQISYSNFMATKPSKADIAQLLKGEKEGKYVIVRDSTPGRTVMKK